MKKLALAAFCLFFFIFPVFVNAHPGRTASDDCHYCRTNCTSWGEVSGARHCHGGYTAPAPVYTAPTIKPIIKPTVVPTIKPTIKPTSEVKGESDEQKTSKPVSTSEKQNNDSDALPLLITVTLGYLIYKKVRKMMRENKERG